jgi:predicted nucleotide-binding protein (sugar kinase/HSP70/actin superfamily)
MAELIYNKEGRLLFTKQMKKEYTLLCPMMLPVHFTMIKLSLEMDGYKVELLNTTHRGIVDEGLKYVHNDTCYPALLVIGQLIDAIKSGKYDPKKVALIITQTGGGCRASNYIHLLRKALVKAGYEYVPVVSLNLSGLEKNPGFSLNITLIRRMIFAVIYGDLIVQVANQCRPYEVKKGSTDELVNKWIIKLTNEFKNTKTLNRKKVKSNMELIMADFAALPLNRVPKAKVGVVGEIYIKYAPLGNNNLEEFLLSEGTEPIVPGLMDFLIFKVDNRLEDIKLYGGKWIKKVVVSIFMDYLVKCQNLIIDAVKSYPQFRVPVHFEHIKKLVKGYVGHGNKMGEGWLLTGEMLELIDSGVYNIVCTQPFGCLPNHIVGKGMIRAIKERHPESNIVAIDYDPGATRINQENRIKLMLSNAKLKTESFTEHDEQLVGV